MSPEEQNAESQRRLRAERLESMGILAAGLAHDFKNLLVGVLLNTQLAMTRARNGQDPEHIVEPLADVASVVEQASTLCDRMLAYAGRGTIRRRPVDLSAVARASLELIGGVLPAGVRIALDLPDGGPPAVGDDLQLRQVISNLVLNAAQAAGPGGVVRIEAAEQVCTEEYLETTFIDTTIKAGRYAVVKVTDNGPGIPKEVQERMFDPFFSTRGGRGLGLAAVLGIVRLHEGAVQIYSEVGRGTTCKVLIPQPESEDAPPVVAAAEPAFRAEGTLLLVDDDPEIRRVGKRILERVGFTVLTAENGKAGVEALAAHREEVVAVLLDLAMPELDGADALAELRAIEDVPIVLMSGFTESEVVDQLKGRRGIAGFVEKPYVPEVLLQSVRRALGL